ncbi:hypothetical protein FACS189419_00610 [Planctomycetales bacterium]|nr:hypothetical protein FACS189419_00610 [Planctomycetales bacterium]
MTNYEPQIGTIRPAAISELWKHEAKEFTPWLVKHIEELSKVLGMQLKDVESEVIAGNLRLDILAKDQNDRNVVIENQIKESDHDHFARIILYASCFNASTVVWIAKEFAPEHCTALNWLNEHSSGISYYGIEIKSIRIDNRPFREDESLPAPQFNIITFPLVQPGQAKLQAQELTAYKQFQLSFWESFRQKLLQKSEPDIARQKAGPNNWYGVELGHSEVSMYATCKRGNKVGIYIYIYPNESVDKVFSYLEERKSEIEESIGVNLQWTPDTNYAVSIYNDKFDLSDESQREQALDWLVEMTIKFYDEFHKQITNLS